MRIETVWGQGYKLIELEDGRASIIRLEYGEVTCVTSAPYLKKIFAPYHRQMYHNTARRAALIRGKHYGTILDLPLAICQTSEKPEWGIGQVQSITGMRVVVNFPEAGKIMINCEHVTLIAVGDRTD